MDDGESICAMCSKLIAVGEGYVVRIDVFADPRMPAVSGEQLAAADFDAALREVLAEADQKSAAELQDDVHRRFAFAICRRCQRRYLENPLPPA